MSDEENKTTPRKRSRPQKDGVTTSLKLESSLYTRTKLKASELKTTTTGIIELALAKFLGEEDSYSFIDDLKGYLIEDKDSIMIPKDLYARLNNLSLAELEVYIAKNKIKVASLASDKKDKNKKTSYMYFNLSDSKSMFGLLFQMEHSIEKIRLDLLKANSKIGALEENLTKYCNSKES